MNYTQNEKIEQVTESTLVLGVDIGSSEHYVRAFDYRGRELTRKVFRFSTDINGFNSFYDWVTQICIKHGWIILVHMDEPLFRIHWASSFIIVLYTFIRCKSIMKEVLVMTKYREILRLSSLGFSNRNIALSVPCSRNTVSKVLKRAKELELSWPLSDDQTDAVLEQMLYPKLHNKSNRRMPDYDYIRKELFRNGVSKKLLKGI